MIEPRVRKNRSPQSCGKCGSLIMMGEREILIREHERNRWWHVSCYLAARDGSWSDTYSVPDDVRARAATEHAVQWLKAHGSKIS